MDTLSEKLGISDLDDFVERRVAPLLQDTPQSRARDSGNQLDTRGLVDTFKNNFYFKFTAMLIALGFGIGLVLPVIQALTKSFNVPPSVFTVSMLLIAGITALFFSRDKILGMFTEGHFRFIHRSHAMKTVCKAIGLEFVPMPGGASESARKLARWKLCPKTFRDLIESMDNYGGLDEIVDIVRRSGLAMPSGLVIASDKNHARYYQDQFEQQQFEDGFSGVRKGIAFSALEWQEMSQNTSKHHLLIVMKLPTRLTGLVEFKNKSESWPIRPRGQDTDKVGLVSSDFHRAFHVRAEDQMEARLIFDPAVIERITEFAQGAPVRGAAFENYLVFDIAGHNRFNMVDLLTGEWSRESIYESLKDIADMLDLIDGIAQVFALKPRRYG